MVTEWEGECEREEGRTWDSKIQQGIDERKQTFN